MPYTSELSLFIGRYDIQKMLTQQTYVKKTILPNFLQLFYYLFSFCSVLVVILLKAFFN